jgi:threonine dehydrogenase-like Zn-dependent dehydrogenase
VASAPLPDGGSVAVFGLGPIGQMCARIAKHRGARVIAADLVPVRLEMARTHGIQVLNANQERNVVGAIRDLTDGRGPDSTIDAVGMEAHGAPVAHAAQTATGLLPSTIAAPLMRTTGVDRLTALTQAMDAVRRGGTVSIIGVYGGMSDPMPMLKMFDKGITLRMGQAHVRRWMNNLLPLVTGDSDPLDVEHLATHRLPLAEAPAAYAMFQKKEDGVVKVVLKP